MADSIKIYKSELEAICRQVSQKQFYDVEVGGDLYGLWTDDGTPIVFLATGPGPQATFSELKFHQDHQEIMRCEEYLFYKYGIQYLGDWHSHHILNLDYPSSGDIKRIQNILRQPNRNKMVEFIVTHEYTRASKNERIRGYYYEERKSPVLIPIEKLDVETSLVRENLLSNNLKMNLMEKYQIDNYSESQSSNQNECLIEEQKSEDVINSELMHYGSFFDGVIEKVKKHLL